MQRSSLARVIAMGLLATCLAFPAPTARGQEAPQKYATAAQGTDAFSFNLYARLRYRDGGETNLFFSPYSISSALSMVYIGARGPTAQEMFNTLGFVIPPGRDMRQGESDETTIAKSFGALNQQLSGDWQRQGFALSVANSLWAQKGEPILPAYLDITKRDFGGEMTPVDFATQPDAVRQQINDWVAQKTQDKIKNLLGPGTISANERLVLANAVYFKGAWLAPFDANKTHKQDFHTRKGDVVQAEMMHDSQRALYAEDDLCQMVELPYNGGQLEMIVLLPKREDVNKMDEEGKPDGLKMGMVRFESAFNDAYLSKLLHSAAERKVNLALPKWESTQTITLGNDLEAMGMKLAFSPQADFSGINGRNDLFLSNVIHKAYVKVDEKGTEAAGATAIVMMGGALPQSAQPVDFTADHPFLYVIMHEPTKTILFAGRLCDPSAQE